MDVAAGHLEWAGFGNKHHTTVMSAVENVATDREKDAAFARQLEELERQILA